MEGHGGVGLKLDEQPLQLAAVPTREGITDRGSLLLHMLPVVEAVKFVDPEGTALTYVWFTTLVGRVGATRGSVTLYFVPVVAILLGAVLLGESIEAVAILGTALVLAGAYLTSREEPAR